MEPTDQAAEFAALICRPQEATFFRRIDFRRSRAVDFSPDRARTGPAPGAAAVLLRWRSPVPPHPEPFLVRSRSFFLVRSRAAFWRLQTDPLSLDRTPSGSPRAAQYVT